jgi:CheY-like chemotaxis protein/HPt (histidine-containing phosphotransfer) domain-containing protein
LTDALQSPVNAVLVAEDDAVSAIFLQEALQSLGLSCTLATDGDVALALARRTRFSALLLDVHLPGRTGPEILAAIRADAGAASRHAPALALTAELGAERAQALRAAGFDAVGSKPLPLAQLAALLRELRLDVAALPLPAAGAAAPWDDARALSAVGGKHDIVARLRGLMLAELPQQRRVLADAFAARRNDLARAELHRLRASCGFCGALALDAAIVAWQRAVDADGAQEDAANRVLLAIDALLDAPPAA